MMEENMKIAHEDTALDSLTQGLGTHCYKGMASLAAFLYSSGFSVNSMAPTCALFARF